MALDDAGLLRKDNGFLDIARIRELQGQQGGASEVSFRDFLREVALNAVEHYYDVRLGHFAENTPKSTFRIMFHILWENDQFREMVAPGFEKDHFAPLDGTADVLRLRGRGRETWADLAATLEGYKGSDLRSGALAFDDAGLLREDDGLLDATRIKKRQQREGSSGGSLNVAIYEYFFKALETYYDAKEDQNATKECLEKMVKGIMTIFLSNEKNARTTLTAGFDKSNFTVPPPGPQRYQYQKSKRSYVPQAKEHNTRSKVPKLNEDSTATK